MRLRTIVWVIGLSLGCGDGPFSYNRRLAREFGSQEFDSAVWAAGGSEARGQMIASLMRSHLRQMTTNERVFSLLGPSECYVNYDDEPCYGLPVAISPTNSSSQSVIPRIQVASSVL